jgi:hypothetical protein
MMYVRSEVKFWPLEVGQVRALVCSNFAASHGGQSMDTYSFRRILNGARCTWFRALVCVATEDVKWASVLRTLLPDGGIQENADPDERLCLRCGRTVDAYPDKEQSEVLEQLGNDRQFSGDFLVTKAVGDKVDEGGDDAPKFTPRVVESQLIMERSFKSKVGYVSQDFLEAKYEISLSASRVKTCDAYDLNGRRFSAVAMPISEIPADWPHLLGSIKFREASFFGETVMQPRDQLREPQALAAFYRHVSALSQGRCADLVADNVGKLQSHKIIMDKVKRALAARTERSTGIDAEMDALVSGKDHVVQPVRVNHRRSGAQGEGAHRGKASDDDPARNPRVVVAASTSRGGSRTRGPPPARSLLNGSAKYSQASGRGRIGRLGSRGGIGSNRSRAASASTLPTPPSARRAPKPLPDQGTGPTVGGYYKHKEFDYFEILNGVAPTRQTAPAT